MIVNEKETKFKLTKALQVLLLASKLLKCLMNKKNISIQTLLALFIGIVSENFNDSHLIVKNSFIQPQDECCR